MLALTACGGGGGGSSNPPPVRGGTTGLARLTITIPSKPASARGRAPAYISSATQSVSITPAGGSKTTIGVTPTSPGCTQSSSGTMCTVELPAPVGTTMVVISTYASTDGSGTPLSTAALTVTIVLGVVNDINVTLNGVVASLAIGVNPSTLAAGVPSTSSVSVNALDAAGQIIIAPGVYVDASGNPLTITLTDSDTSGQTSLSQTTVTAPTAGITLHYNGGPIASFTVSASAPGVGTATATVVVNNPPPASPAIYIGYGGITPGCGNNVNPTTVAARQLVSPGGVGPAIGTLSAPTNEGWISADRVGHLFVFVSPFGSGTAGFGIFRYPLGATGNPTPSAKITNGNSNLFNGVQIAADSAGGVWVAEPVFGGNGAAPRLEHFAPNASGDATPDRVVTGVAGIPPPLVFDAGTVAVDSHDNVYTVAESASPGGGSRVYELPPNANGNATPIASYGDINTGGSRSTVFVDQHTDAVWAHTQGSSSNGPDNGVVEFPAGSATPSRILYGETSFPDPHDPNPNPINAPVREFGGLAFDSAGNVYVQYETYFTGISGHCSGTHAISTFSPAQNGNVTPLQNFVVGPSSVPMMGLIIPYTTPPTSGPGGPGTPSSAIMPSPSTLSFLATGPRYAQALTVTGSTGPYTAKSQNTAVVTVTPPSSSGAFTVTPVGAGQTTIIVSDANGNYATVNVAVSIGAYHLQGHRR